MVISAEEIKKRNNLKKRALGSYKKAKEAAPTVKTGTFGPPAGVKGGAARFTGFTFDELDDGTPWFNLKFVALDPADINGEKVAGRQFRLSHFINDSQYSTVEERMAGLCSDIQLFGGEGITADLPDDDFDPLFELLDELSEEKPFVQFDSFPHKFKQGKRKGETEVRYGLTGPITEDTDKDWYNALLTAAEQFETEADRETDPAPPARTTAAAKPSGNGSARPATNSRTSTTVNATSPGPTQTTTLTPTRGGRPASNVTPPEHASSTGAPARRRGSNAPAPVPEPEPIPDPDQFVVAVDDAWDCMVEAQVEVQVKKGRKMVTEMQVQPVRAKCKVVAVDEQAEICDLQDLEYPDVTYQGIAWDKLIGPDDPDVPADDIPF